MPHFSTWTYRVNLVITLTVRSHNYDAGCTRSCVTVAKQSPPPPCLADVPFLALHTPDCLSASDTPPSQSPLSFSAFHQLSCLGSGLSIHLIAQSIFISCVEAYVRG